MQQGPMNISCNNQINNQIVCVDAKCTCFAHSVLHLTVITSDMT